MRIHSCPISRASQLSGTAPHETSAEVEENLERTHSRSRVFAKDEDIKMCEAEIIRNAPAPVLVEAALQRETGSYLTDTGALSVRSGAKTGRSPKDKRVVAEPNSEDNVWWGPVRVHPENASCSLLVCIILLYCVLAGQYQDEPRSLHDK